MFTISHQHLTFGSRRMQLQSTTTFSSLMYQI